MNTSSPVSAGTFRTLASTKTRTLPGNGGRRVIFGRRFFVASRLAAEKIIEAEAKGETVTLQEAGDEFGISRQAVHKAVKALSTESSHKEELVDMPSHIKGNSSQADFRKLSPEGQERAKKF